MDPGGDGLYSLNTMAWSFSKIVWVLTVSALEAPIAAPNTVHGPLSVNPVGTKGCEHATQGTGHTQRGQEPVSVFLHFALSTVVLWTNIPTVIYAPWSWLTGAVSRRVSAKVLLLNIAAGLKLDLDRPLFTTGDVLSSGNIVPSIPVGEVPEEMLTGLPTLEEVETASGALGGGETASLVALSVLAGASCDSMAPCPRFLRASGGSGVAGSSRVLFARRSVTIRPCVRDPGAVILLLKAVNLVDMTRLSHVVRVLVAGSFRDVVSPVVGAGVVILIFSSFMTSVATVRFSSAILSYRMC